ncbi:MAG: dicarboxylate/amino acid:cation symporter [Chlorobia bacterium]|nr:dicarboxylate/amino acid:cation symporter [Fimbriimonadaceae bacterium]
MDGNGVSPKKSGWMALLGPLCLILGFALGAYTHSSQTPFLVAAAGHLDPIGQLWLNALKVAVVPLVSILLITGIATLPSGKELGRWGGMAMASFFAMLLLGVTVALAAGSIFVNSVHIDRITPPTSTTAGAIQKTAEISDWVSGLIPGNLIEAMGKGDLLPIAIISALFALALRKAGEEKRSVVLSFATGVRDTILVYVGWVVQLLPIGGFALAFSFAAKSGGAILNVTLQFIVYGYALMIAFGVLLYLLVAVIGRIKPSVFAKGILPAQIVALGSRSSLASLPSMVQCAKSLNLPDPASEVVLPMAVSLFKLNRALTSTSKLLFFATVFGVALGPQAIAAYVVTVIMVSFSTPGLPTGAGASNLGAYMAAGLPAEGYMLIEAVNPILDPMNTVLNVTGDLAAAAITSRFAASGAD